MPCIYCHQPTERVLRADLLDYVVPGGMLKVPVTVPWDECGSCGAATFGVEGEAAREAALDAAKAAHKRDKAVFVPTVP